VSTPTLDPQLTDFLATRQRADADQVLESLRRQRAGHWHDLVLDSPPSAQEPSLPLAEVAVADESDSESTTWYERRDIFGIGLSLLFHLLVLIVIACWFFPQRGGQGPLVLEGLEAGPQLSDIELRSDQLALAQEFNHESLFDRPWPVPHPTLPSRVETSPLVATEPWETEVAPQTTEQFAEGGGGLSGRSAENRPALVIQGGGNEQSELAVDRGLDWLARHQWPDGGWSFRHPPGSQSKNAGSSASRTAATGLALLCFLGRNHHHAAESQYQKVVLDGLNYLLKVSQNGDLTQLTEHSMYGQGIASLALAEAYALSRDSALKKPTQQAIDFIVQAQHPLGGWRYQPGQIGDINVTGWQLMALKTARMAGLDVPDATLQKATRFVDSQAVSPGAFFTYPGLDPTVPQPVPTAIGLLLRMFQGWGHGREEFQMGTDYLASRKVSADHIYYNYYTTMVLFHYGGPLWKAWNQEMRDFLLNTQHDLGPERGSWFFPHLKTGGEGGRLYCTTMAILILEVYYRHLRLYDSSVLVRDFPLD